MKFKIIINGNVSIKILINIICKRMLMIIGIYSVIEKKNKKKV